MTPEVQEILRILCRLLAVEAIPAKDVVTVQRWVELPGFTVDRFRLLALSVQQRGVKINSVSYLAPLVAETFRSLPAAEGCRTVRPRLLSERPWPEYYERYVAHWGTPDAQVTLDLWFRWNCEREIVGLPIEEKWYEVRDPLSRIRDAKPGDDPLAVAA